MPVPVDLVSENISRTFQTLIGKAWFPADFPLNIFNHPNSAPCPPQGAPTSRTLPRGRRVRLRYIAAADDAAAPGGARGAETSTSEGGGDGPEATGAGPAKNDLLGKFKM